MNPSEFATSSLPSDACTLDTIGSYGADRITRTSFDNAGRPNLVQTGYGVSGVQADEVAATYTDNGRVATVTDAEGNRTSYAYDGHDRLSRTYLPSPTTDNSSSTTDYEELTYVLAASGTRSTSLVSSRRNRAGQIVSFGYDSLNRMILRDRPNAIAWELDVAYQYDNLGRLVSASDSYTHSFTFAHDALGRVLSETDNWFGTTSFAWDAAGRRTRLTWRDGFYVDYVYDAAGEMIEIRENGATSGIGLLARYAYDDRGRRVSLTRGNGTVTSYGYDDVSRLSQLVQNLSGTSYDLTLDFSYDPASGIAAVTRSNDVYAWGGHYAVNRNYTTNGLNQYSAAGSASFSYDANGNLTSDGTHTFAYDVDNRLTSANGQLYDPLERLFVGGSSAFIYDGQIAVAEANPTYGTMLRRYVHGPGTDEPLVWYEGSGTSDRHWLHADERGSIVALSNDSGGITDVNTYDEYGIPGSNAGRFQYTGQMWLPELGMYHYRARAYSPTLGRFLQTDPIGFGGGMNLYAYVGNDPVNRIDPLGLCQIRTFGLVKTTDWGPVKFGEQALVDKWFEFDGCGSPTYTGTGGLGGPGDIGTGQPSGEDGPPILVTALWRPEDRSEELFRLLSATQQPLPPGYLPYPESGDRMMYRRNDPRRTPVLTPARQRSACQNYDRLTRSNAEVGLAGVGLGTLFRSGPAGLLVWIGNAVNALLAFSDRPPGC